MVAARRAMARMIDTLGDGDRFCVLAFDNTVETPAGLPDAGSSRRPIATDSAPSSTSPRSRRAAGPRWPSRSSGPSTAAAETRTRSRIRRVAIAILVLVTDGQVGNEDQILQTLGAAASGIRVFTLGIDRAVNEAFLRRLAELRRRVAASWSSRKTGSTR